MDDFSKTETPHTESLDALSPVEKRRMLAKLLRKRRDEETRAPNEFPLTAGQQALWYAHLRDPSVTAYNVFLPVRFRSRFDLEAMRRAIAELPKRHGALRTVFAARKDDLAPVQRRVDVAEPEFEVVDANGWSDDQIRAAALEEVQRPFRLTEDVLLRIVVFRIAADDFVVVATTHHIVVDFWSLILMLSDIRSLYPSFAAGEQAKIAAVPDNYFQFVDAQQKLLASPSRDSLSAYWKDTLSGVPSILNWPLDYRRSDPFTHRAGTHPISFSSTLLGKVKRLAAQHDVTANVVITAALQVFVARWCGQDAFAMGMPFSGRLDRAFESTVGFFVNMLPIVADVSANPSFNAYIDSVGERMIGALANEALPLAEIVRLVAPPRDPSRHPLFQVSCTFEKSHRTEESGRAGFLMGTQQSFDDFAGIRQESFFIPHPTCHYDVEFVFELADDQLRGLICYCADLFDAATIDSMAVQFSAMIDSLVELPEKEVHSVAWRNVHGNVDPMKRSAADPVPPATLVSLLDDCDDSIVLRAKCVAARLHAAGVRPHEMVPVCMSRGPNAWVGILAVMFAGAIALPIDADQPAVDFETVRSDADIRFVITDNGQWVTDESVQRVPVDDEQDDWMGGEVAPDIRDLAYVIYTSGTTGKSKGVAIEHAAIAGTLIARSRRVPLRTTDRVLMLISHQFDASMVVVLTALHQEAQVVWPDSGNALDVEAIIDTIIEHEITILPAVPSLLRLIVSHPRFERCRSLRQIWSGGESLSESLVETIEQKTSCEIWNFYGPTETAVEATAHRVGGSRGLSNVPIGHELDGVVIHLLDRNQRPVPTGVPGEIAIAGHGLARGYLNREQATDAAFISIDLPGHGTPTRLHLTGDLGRRRADGTIEFLGRRDHQEKLRGYRIAFEEIEDVLSTHIGVRRAAVKVVDREQAGERLIAYVEAEPSVSLADLRREVANALPSFKRPSDYVRLERLPIGASGKVLRGQLPDPPKQRKATVAHVPPRNAFEQFLMNEFEASLGLGSVGVEESFFDLGGTSLQAAMLASQLARDLTIPVPASFVFELGSVAAIAAKLVEKNRDVIESRFGVDSVIDCVTATDGGERPESLLVDFNEARIAQPDSRPALFFVHPPGGVVACYRELAIELEETHRVIGIRARGVLDERGQAASLPAMAEEYVQAIMSRGVEGGVVLGGWSLGGVIAYEVGQQMLQRGGEVKQLILLDSTVPERSDETSTSAGIEYGIDLSLEELGRLPEDQQLPFLYRHAESLGVIDEQMPRDVVEKVIGEIKALFSHHVQLCQRYSISRLDVPTLLIRPRDVPVSGSSDAGDRLHPRGWDRWVSTIAVQTVAGHHHSMIRQPGVSEMAQHIRAIKFD